MNKRLIYTLLAIGVCLVIAGSLLLMRSRAINEEYVYTPDSTEVAKQDSGGVTLADSSNSNVGYPTRVVIDDIAINIAVEKGYYNKTAKKWTISRQKAYYAVMTARPNSNGGNTFIYGHNRSNIFARLFKVKSGSIAYVVTDDNKKYMYRFDRSFTTNPNDSKILNYEGEPILTLQTCSGANFQNRTLFVFKLVGVTNA